MKRQKLAVRVYEAIFGKQTKPTHKRYAAASINRHNADWTAWPVSVNYELRRDLAILRARSREMCANAPHFKKFLSMCRSNIIGQKGIQLQCRARISDSRTLNAPVNKKVEEAFWAWSFAENCTVTGKMDWIAAQRLFVTQLARDGEVLVQHIRDAANPFGYSVKFWNVDYLDETYNIDVPGKNRIIMSVEIDDNDKPVAYWLTTPASDTNFTKRHVRSRFRVPAEDMIHAFLVYDDESQVRGVTWFHAALRQGKDMSAYKEGVIMSARFTANAFGTLESEIADDATFDGLEDSDGNAVVPYIDSSPMAINQLPPGYSLKQFDPNQPTQNHSAFTKTLEMELATALGVPYFELSGDMEAVNFSSARVGQGDSRDVWRSLQDFVAATFCRPVYHQWLESAILSGQLKILARDYKEVQNPIWRGRGWPYLDPLKEINATVIAIENKLETWTGALNEQGIDIYDHFETIKQEQELAAGYGIDLTIASKTAATEPAEPDADEETKPPTKEKKQQNGHSFEHYEN